MPDSLQLNSLIQQLKLSGISDSLESRLRQAKDAELPYEELLSMLLQDELDSRDLDVDAKPSTNIYRVVTVTSIGRPRKGDIAYSVSSGKFKGYVSTAATKAWQDLN